MPHHLEKIVHRLWVCLSVCSTKAKPSNQIITLHTNWSIRRVCPSVRLWNSFYILVVIGLSCYHTLCRNTRHQYQNTHRKSELRDLFWEVNLTNYFWDYYMGVFFYHFPFSDSSFNNFGDSFCFFFSCQVTNFRIQNRIQGVCRKGRWKSKILSYLEMKEEGIGKG